MSGEVDHVEIIQQALIHPVTDATCDRSSMTENAEGYMLTADGMDWFHGHCANSPDDHAELLTILGL